VRVVADTNIYVSAYNFGGTPSRILELAQEGQLILFVSQPILQELAGVLRRKFAWSEDLASRTVSNILRFAHLVTPRHKLTVIEDPGDNRILECAVEARADIIVTGDRHLLKLKTFQGTTILTARQFLRVVQGSGIR
jgi:putative PIN family toxin of toxin-antitoxin system